MCNALSEVPAGKNIKIMTINYLKRFQNFNYFRLTGSLIFITAFICSGAVRSTDKEVKIAWFNLHNYIFGRNSDQRTKSPESKEETENEIVQINPDILLVCELGGHDSLKELTESLQKKGLNFPYTSLVEAGDSIINLAVLSKIKPLKTSHCTDIFYRNKGKRYQVLRGFAHCIFRKKNGYLFHIFSAHLKSNYGPDKEGNSVQRQSEARALRRIFKPLMKEGDNFLIFGDMNDSQDSKTLKILMNRDKQAPEHLFDIRPLDKTNISWTIYWGRKDRYSRFDYILASENIIPEIDLSKTKIPFFPAWLTASDHRPLVITIETEDKPLTPDLLKMFNFYGVRKTPAEQPKNRKKD
jgi:endonuclease/exonuclease/phosphatase family metal-dependent hydrolase